MNKKQFVKSGNCWPLSVLIFQSGVIIEHDSSSIGSAERTYGGDGVIATTIFIVTTGHFTDVMSFNHKPCNIYANRVLQLANIWAWSGYLYPDTCMIICEFAPISPLLFPTLWHRLTLFSNLFDDLLSFSLSHCPTLPSLLHYSSWGMRSRDSFKFIGRLRRNQVLGKTLSIRQIAGKYFCWCCKGKWTCAFELMREWILAHQISSFANLLHGIHSSEESDICRLLLLS